VGTASDMQEVMRWKYVITNEQRDVAEMENFRNMYNLFLDRLDCDRGCQGRRRVWSRYGAM